jgi:hypothetical protein
MRRADLANQRTQPAIALESIAFEDTGIHM